MADILPFKRKSAPKRSALCTSGHHRWVIWQNKPFENKQGKLVTVYRCERCGVERTQAQ
ncbi:MAG: hypothetical protein WCI66_08040 [Gammaproteobacteria bacterium]